MKSKLLASLLFISLLFNFTSLADAAVKTGSACKKIGQTSVVKGKTFTCIKSGKKKVWSKGAPVKTASPVETPSPTPSPTPTPSQTPSPLPTSTPEESLTVPETFEDLLINPHTIAYGAWVRSKQISESAKSEMPPIKLNIGPSVDLSKVDYSAILQKVVQLFPEFEYPKNNYVYVYGKRDLVWANQQMESLFTPSELSILQNSEGGSLVESNCRPDCLWAKAQYSAPRNIYLMLFGADHFYQTESKDINFFSNALWAHEFVHTMQDVQTFNGGGSQISDFPPNWWTEGSAQFVQIVVQSTDSFEMYKRYSSFYSLPPLSEKSVNDFLDESKISTEWREFSQYTYELGTRVIEILVSIKGPSIILQLNKEIIGGVGFTNAFKKIFGMEWKVAVPKIAKLISGG